MIEASDFAIRLTPARLTRKERDGVLEFLLGRVGRDLALPFVRIVVDGPATAPAAEREYLRWQAPGAATGTAGPLSRPILITGAPWGRLEFGAPADDHVWTDRAGAEAEALADLVALLAGRGDETGPGPFLDALPEPALVCDADGTVCDANDAAATLSGRALAELIGHPAERILDILPAEAHAPGCVRHADGRLLPVLIRTGRLGTTGLLLVRLHPVSAEAPDPALLRQIAFQDETTGLANRQALLDGDIPCNTAIAIRLLDRLDLPQSAQEDGTSVLRTIAGLVRSAIAERPARLVRSAAYGLAVFTEADGEEALALARAIRTPFKGPIRVGERQVPVRLSFGIAQGKRPAAQLLRDAEFACHPDRAGAIQRFETALRTRLEDRRLLEADLRAALRDDDPGLGLAFQPTVALASGLVVGFEALARWQHPVRGAISPAVFVPLAESAGLMIALGSRVVDQAARAVRLWNDRRQARRLPPVFVSANLSAHQVVDPDLTRILAGIISRHRLTPGHLRLELAETTLMERPAQSANLLGAIARLGIGLSIDDFGLGPSSLGHLHRFHVDALKIDRQFIAGMVRSERERTVVAAIIGVARQLGLEPVAEGIETRETADALVALGCALGQGFLFGRPVSHDAAEALILPDAGRETR